MRLFAQLLARELIENRHFFGELLRRQKTGAEELDLTDQLVVRDYADHRSEEGFDGLREFCTTGISWIHGDENSHFRVQHDVLAFELSENVVFYNRNVIGMRQEFIFIDIIEK